MLRALRLAGGVLLVPLAAWCAAALWFDGAKSPYAAAALLAVFAGALAWIAFFLEPARRRLPAAWLLCLAVVVWWRLIPPSNERDWQADVARVPTAEIDGDLVTVHDIRNFDYRGENDFTENWDARTFDLSKLQGLDMFFSYWGSPSIAHTILSWDFGDGWHLAVSIETRKEVGEEYSAVRGFFRQYELIYVAADERDVIRLRPNVRGEEVYLYRLNVPLERARAMLLDYLEEMNRLAERPRWYNALAQNCTTTIRMHTRHIAPERPPFDWRILVNGYADRMLYERGLLDTSIPFEELRARSRINERSLAADRDPAYSERIRQAP